MQWAICWLYRNVYNKFYEICLKSGKDSSFIFSLIEVCGTKRCILISVRKPIIMILHGRVKIIRKSFTTISHLQQKWARLLQLYLHPSSYLIIFFIIHAALLPGINSYNLASTVYIRLLTVSVQYRPISYMQ